MVIQVCQEIKGGLGNFSCGEPLLDALVAKPEHSRTQLAGEGQAIGMAVEPIRGSGKDLRGCLCVQEVVPIMVPVGLFLDLRSDTTDLL